MSFIASSFSSSSFVSIRRIHLAGSLTIRASDSRDPPILPSDRERNYRVRRRRAPSPSVVVRHCQWEHGGRYLVNFDRPMCFLWRAIYFFFLFYPFFFFTFFPCFRFFPPFFTKTERAALENRIDTACKNNAKMSGDASPGKQGRPRPCKIACSIHGRALIRGEFSLSFTAARKQRQHDFHE